MYNISKIESAIVLNPVAMSSEADATMTIKIIPMTTTAHVMIPAAELWHRP